jgi:RNA polymerase sigma-70 factor (ECF subfamily)
MSEYDKAEVQDSLLIRQAKRGDRSAFGALYERYVDPIFRYVRSRVDDDHTAEDLTEAVFLRSFEAIGTYRDRGLRYSAYLYQVARNLLIDHYRREEDALSLERAESLLADESSTDDEIIRREQAATIRRAIDRLPEEYQEIIRLRVLLEIPTAEAAEWLKRSEGATRVLLHRALKALKREVDGRREPNARQTN